MRKSSVGALLLVLSFSQGAYAILVPLHDYSITIGGKRFGIVDWPSTLSWPPDDPPISYTTLYFGPFGDLKVPFNARLGAAGLIACVFLAGFGLFLVIRRLQRRAA